MTPLTPYLSFNGQCETAFTFYAKHLAGQLGPLYRYAGSPMANEVPPDWQNQVMHARVTFGDQTLMGADNPPARYQKPRGFSLSLSPKSESEARRLFDALSQNGQVEMPLQKTFWAEAFVVLTDQFGIPWTINCEQSISAF